MDAGSTLTEAVVKAGAQEEENVTTDSQRSANTSLLARAMETMGTTETPAHSTAVATTQDLMADTGAMKMITKDQVKKEEGLMRSTGGDTVRTDTEDVTTATQDSTVMTGTTEETDTAKITVTMVTIVMTDKDVKREEQGEEEGSH